MATYTILPNADYIIGIVGPAASHYDKLLSQDDGSTTVYNNGNAGWQYDVYDMPLTFGHGTPNSVNVVFRALTNHSLYTKCKAGIRINGVDYFGAEHNPNGAWTTYTETWATNPATGGAWTIDDIASLRLVLGLYAVNNWTSQCTQIKLSIDHTPFGVSAETLFNGGACSTSSGTYVDFLNAISDLPAGALRINRVVILYSVYDNGSNYGAYGKSALLSNSGYAYGSEHLVSSDLKSYSQDYATNPITGATWTKEDINALQAGVSLHNRAGSGYTTQCSDVVVVVSYTTDQAPAIPSTPTGPSSGLPGVSYSFSAATTDPEGDQVKYIFGFGDNTGWFETGWFSSGATGTLSHAYAAPGTYQICVKAIDPSGAESDISSFKTVVINTPPDMPSTPSGNASGIPATSYSYTFSTIDDDGQNVYYIVDWGDQETTQTIYYASGATATASHSWDSPGTYGVKVKAVDSMGAVSAWSSIKTVVIAYAQVARRAILVGPIW